jgi:hypothetical protein
VNHPTILALGYSEAAMLLRSESGSDIQVIITIAGQRECTVEADTPHRLDLHFDDVPALNADDPVAAYRTRARQRKAGDMSRPPRCCAWRPGWARRLRSRASNPCVMFARGLSHTATWSGSATNSWGVAGD